MSPDDPDLSDLKRALDAATPRPAADVRAAHLRLAQDAFDRPQGRTGGPRPTSRRHRVWTGARDMLTTMTTRGGLAATTALVACGVLLATPAGQDLWRRGPAAPPVTAERALPAAADNAPAPYATSQAAEASDVPAAPASATDPEDAFLPRPDAGPDASEPLADAGMELEGDEAPVDEGMAVPGAPAPAGAGPGLMAGSEAPLARAAPVPLAPDAVLWPPPSTEAFANAEDNPLRITSEEPVSTFSIDVDTASYAVVRRSLAGGDLPLPDAVRVEEMVNYFPYAWPAPAPGAGPFRPTVSVMRTPWNAGTHLVTVAIQGERPAVADRPPLNLVVLIDTSGSMDDPAKLPLLVQSLRLMVDELRPDDEVAIVAYAGAAGLVLPPTPASDRGAILAALDGLMAGGSTNGQGGLEQAYEVVEDMAAAGEVGRVILATDGDFNVGISDPEALADFIADRRDSGAYLSVLGFGRGNLDDATMQALAQNGNGQAAYIDTAQEAQKVLVDQLTGALFAIAEDVKVEVEWNPAEIAEYRLIGYETRALAREDFNDDRVDAGELGAGHSVTAIYEVTPVGSPAQLADPLRYQPEAAATGATGAPSGEWGFLRLRWKAPGGEESALLELPITGEEGAGGEARFAAAIAGWGQLLRGAPLGDWGYDEAIALALGARGADPYGYRTEAVRLMRLSRSLAE